MSEKSLEDYKKMRWQDLLKLPKGEMTPEVSAILMDNFLTEALAGIDGTDDEF